MPLVAGPTAPGPSHLRHPTQSTRRGTPLTYGSGIALKLLASALSGWATESGYARPASSQLPKLRAAANLLMVPKQVKRADRGGPAGGGHWRARA